MEKKQIRQELLKGERALFASEDLEISDSIFDEGESPLKESKNIALYNCMFRWKYPLWYCSNVKAVDCSWFDMARAGVWYSRDVCISRALIEAPKNFRRCEGLTLEHVRFVHAEETLWHCKKVVMKDVLAKGDYFGLNCEDVSADGLELVGNYSFDGAKNVEIRNAKLLSKDAFWNSDNVTVVDSFISGEYLGWNARNLTFINCTIESLQGLCYIDGLTMKNCKLLNTTLAFEYSSVEADITGFVDSVMNPTEGRITADSIGTLILEKDRIDPTKTRIICRKDT